MPSVNTGDLRSEAKDFQRDKNHKSKWARGAWHDPKPTCTHEKDATCVNCKKCPMKAPSFCYKTHQDKSNGPNVSRRVFRKDVVEALDDNDNSDSSVSDDIVDASAAPEPDAEIMYSYDSHTGPGRGSQILSFAINQAVQRFENNETEKIVKEYDLVLDGKDELEFADTEDDFEVIDASQLR